MGLKCIFEFGFVCLVGGRCNVQYSGYIISYSEDYGYIIINIFLNWGCFFLKQFLGKMVCSLVQGFGKGEVVSTFLQDFFCGWFLVYNILVVYVFEYFKYVFFGEQYIRGYDSII